MDSLSPDNAAKADDPGKPTIDPVYGKINYDSNGSPVYNADNVRYNPLTGEAAPIYSPGYNGPPVESLVTIDKVNSSSHPLFPSAITQTTPPPVFQPTINAPTPTPNVISQITGALPVFASLEQKANEVILATNKILSMKVIIVQGGASSILIAGENATLTISTKDIVLGQITGSRASNAALKSLLTALSVVFTMSDQTS